MIAFSNEQMGLFARASHDVNPLHCSAEYARSTPFGEPVVYGALAALACLAKIEPRPGFAVSRIAVEFGEAAFVGIDYRVQIDASEFPQVSVGLFDGGLELLRMEIEFAEGDRAAPFPSSTSGSPRAEAATHAAADLAATRMTAGEYAVDWIAARALLDQLSGGVPGAISPASALGLLFASYFVGMEAPGRDALFSSAELVFGTTPAAGVLSYRMRSAPLDERFARLTVEGTLADPSGAAAVELGLKAFLRQKAPAATDRGRRGSARFEQRTALVIGASRGLGAELSRALLGEGADLVCVFQRSVADAAAIAETTGGTARLVQGDAGDAAWIASVCADIDRDAGGLDLLVCCASPALRPMSLAPSTVARVDEYVRASLALVSAPLAAALPLLARRQGRVVILSSSSVAEVVPEWPHYVAAKCAIEGLARTVSAQAADVRFLVARPPRFLSDFSNTPLGRSTALSADRVSAVIVDALAAPDAPRYRLLERFDRGI